MTEQQIPAYMGPRIGSQEDLYSVPGGPEVLRPLREVRATGAAGVAAGRPGGQHHGAVPGSEGEPQRLRPPALRLRPREPQLQPAAPRPAGAPRL